MTTPEVTRCPDGHLRRVIYGLGPYIADYPEQVLLACIAQNWCARYVFNLDFNFTTNMLSPDVRLTGRTLMEKPAYGRMSIPNFSWKLWTVRPFGMNTE